MRATGPATPSFGLREVRAGRDISVTVNQQFAAPEQSRDEWPKLVGFVPPRAAGLRHRGIAGELGTGGTVVLAGMSGAGKTQLAVGHAGQLLERGDLDLLVWLTAESREAVQLGYLAAAAAVFGEEAVGEQAIRRFLTWLAETSRSWLVVLDGLIEVEDLRELWPPRHKTGQTVVTTREDDAVFSPGVRRIRVDPFDETEAVAYLRSRQAGSPGRAAGADELANALLGFPPTLAHAASWVAMRDATYAEFLHSWSARRDRLRPVHSALAHTNMPLQNGFSETVHLDVVATCALMLDLADGLVRPVLDLAARVAGGPVPMAFFESPALSRFLATSTGRDVTTDDVRHAVNQAARLGLVTVDDRRSVRLDGWVRRILLEHLYFAREQAREALVDQWSPPPGVNDVTAAWLAAASAPDPPALGERAAGDALLDAWPEPRGEAGPHQVFFSAARALRSWAEEELWRGRCHPVLIRAGTALKDAGLTQPAALYFQYLHRKAVRHLGQDHPDTHEIRGHLLVVRGLLVHDDADPLRELLAEQTRTLGPLNRATLSTRGKVAFAQASTTPGDRGGEEELAKVLDDQRRILGRTDADTLLTRYFLGCLRFWSGDLDGALRELKKLEKDQRRALKHDHPYTLYTRQLVLETRAAKEETGVLGALEELIADQRRVLGRDSEKTLVTRHNLAVLRLPGNDPLDGADELGSVLADFTRVFGPDHRETLAVRRNLAATWAEAGDDVGALAQLEGVLRDAVRVFTPDDRDLEGLRRLHDERRHSACWEVFDEFERIWGPGWHLSQRKAAVSSASSAGDALAMARFWREILESPEAAASREAEGELSVRRILACWLGIAGYPADAAAQLGQVLEEASRTCGPDHRITRTARHNLGFWRSRAVNP